MINRVLFGLGLTFSTLTALHAATVPDLKGWVVKGDMQLDPAKPGPDGAPSIKVGPESEAMLVLRPEDGSGKISFSVYDDGTVAAPDQKKSVGPRWGVTLANGRVFVGGIMYAKFLKPEGSICLIDADPKDKSTWGTMKFAGVRGAAGWKKWEIEFDSTGVLKMAIDGTPIPAKYLEGSTHATGFNGLVLYGDATKSATPQTVWISGLTYELGGAAAATTASPAGTSTSSATTAAPSAAAAAPAIVSPANAPPPPPDSEGSSMPAPVMATAPTYVPGPGLADDLKNANVVPFAGYLAHHPRLLFSNSDQATLQQKAKDNPELWNAVLESAKGLASMPTPDMIKAGTQYWRIRSVESAAIAWFVTGDVKYRDLAVPWMVTYCQQPIWGTGFRDNMDLQASWNLYYLSIAYDVFYSQLSEADRKTIRDGLASHAKVLYDSIDPATFANGKISFDQNHTYNPIVALTAASLVLYGNVPDAAQWLNRAHAAMQRCRYVLNEDGYYYEGFGYWMYAMHWHARYADLMARALGEKLFDLPALHDNWLFALYLSLPGIPGCFDVGDTYLWKLSGVRPVLDITNYSLLWDIARATNSGESRTVADMYNQRHPDLDDPASAFLWFSPEVKPVALDTIKPYHYFPDMDVVSWRSSWKPDGTCYLFRCGPPIGHSATAKLDQLKDWGMNTGHVHADIGSFYMYGKGAYLAVGTGYTAEKWTRDHNTLLIDGKGQASDGEYHNARGVPYQDLDQAHIDRIYLNDAYGFASGEMGASYTRQVPGVKLRRTLLMTGRWMLVIDDMTSDQEHKLTWLCHTDGAFQAEGTSFVAHLPSAALGVVPLSTEAVTSEMGPTMVTAGNKPGQGKPEQHGFQLSLTQSQPAKTMRMINLLVPLGADEKLPVAEPIKQEGSDLLLSLKWPDGKTEEVRLNLDWKSGTSASTATAEPAEITLKP